ncbi:hypothetical protein ACHAW5_003689 [Stephanodiscus triporus]|uniref:Uncharacterized protein n=1 Tax=Stephanodiscus triporus TaxID=2934178 RepID=A0ABD3QJM3_9STRA
MASDDAVSFDRQNDRELSWRTSTVDEKLSTDSERTSLFLITWLVTLLFFAMATMFLKGLERNLSLRVFLRGRSLRIDDNKAGARMPLHCFDYTP